MPDRDKNAQGHTSGRLMFQSLREAHDWLDAIIESSYDGIYITDGDAVTVRINRAYELISGLKAREVVGRSMGELVRDGVISRSGTLQALERREPVTLEQTFKTGRHALISSTPVFDGQGRVVMVVTNVRDLTELRDLQEKYRQTEALSQKYWSEIEFARKQVLASADLVAVDPKMLAVLTMAGRVAPLDTTVLLLGETGVGKEKVAKYIYKNSARRDERFLTVNCGAIPANLIESELFGYASGAFTGASREGKLGLFVVADKGTLFLDEVGELPLDMQVKLLRVLQERQVTPVGGSEPIPIDVRVVAATNRDLQQMVKDKTFREDLYYRLNVVPITIPPLRERRDDIIPFLTTFLDELNHRYGLHKTFTRGAIHAMLEYDWPGNVRELRNVVERMVVMSGGDQVWPEDLPFHPSRSPAVFAPDLDAHVDLKELVEAYEYRFLVRAYAKYGSVRAAAASLGMDASTFVRKRKRYEAQRPLQK